MGTVGGARVVGVDGEGVRGLWGDEEHEEVVDGSLFGTVEEVDVGVGNVGEDGVVEGDDVLLGQKRHIEKGMHFFEGGNVTFNWVIQWF